MVTNQGHEDDLKKGLHDFKTTNEFDKLINWKEMVAWKTTTEKNTRHTQYDIDHCILSRNHKYDGNAISWCISWKTL